MCSWTPARCWILPGAGIWVSSWNSSKSPDLLFCSSSKVWTLMAEHLVSWSPFLWLWQTPQTSSLRRRGFVLAHSLVAQFVMVVGYEAASHTASTVKGCCVEFLFLFIQSRVPAQEKAWPTVVGPPTLVTLTKENPQVCPGACLLSDSLSLQVGNWY